MGACSDGPSLDLKFYVALTGNNDMVSQMHLGFWVSLVFSGPTGSQTRTGPYACIPWISVCAASSTAVPEAGHAPVRSAFRYASARGLGPGPAAQRRALRPWPAAQQRALDLLPPAQPAAQERALDLCLQRSPQRSGVLCVLGLQRSRVSHAFNRPEIL